MEKREGATEIPNRHACSSRPVFGKIEAVGQNDGVVLRCQAGHLIIYREPSRECFRLSVGKRNEVGKTVSESSKSCQPDRNYKSADKKNGHPTSKTT